MLRMNIRFRHPKVIEFIESLPQRQRSRTIETLLLRAIEQGAEERDLAKRVAEEVGRWLVENGVSAGNAGGSQGPETRGQHVPHNAVTAFLQKWGDDD